MNKYRVAQHVLGVQNPLKYFEIQFNSQFDILIITVFEQQGKLTTYNFQNCEAHEVKAMYLTIKESLEGKGENK